MTLLEFPKKAMAKTTTTKQRRMFYTIISRLFLFRPSGQNMPYHYHFTLLSGHTSWVHQGGYKEYISQVSPLWQQK